MLSSSLLFVLLPLATPGPQDPEVRSVVRAPIRLRVALRSPGGELPFELLVPAPDSRGPAVVLNGDERIELPSPRLDGERWVVDFPPYESQLKLRKTSRGLGIVSECSRNRVPRPPQKSTTFTPASCSGIQCELYKNRCTNTDN